MTTKIVKAGKKRDAAVEQDSVLGSRRKCLPKENYLSEMKNKKKDLCMVAEANPENKAAIQYLGALYLLAKNMDGFKKMVETYYGTINSKRICSGSRN